MGTYVDAAFGHSGDLDQVFKIGTWLIEREGFRPNADAGCPEFSRAALQAAWESPSLIRNHLILESDQFLLWLYARGGKLHHVEVRWWAFAQNGLMDSGLGRDAVRERSRSIASRFQGDRILYIPDSRGINRLCDKVGIDEEEADLREHSGPPADWNEEVTDDNLRGKWFREELPGSLRI